MIHKLGVVHTGKFEPLVSAELFNQVQNTFKRKNTIRHYRIENPDFPLRRFVFSPEAKTLTGCWSQGVKEKYAYYRFSGNGKMFPKQKLEDLFTSFLNSFSVDESFIQELKALVIKKLGNASETKKQLIDELIVKQQKLKERQQLLVDKNIQGVLPDILFKEQLDLLNEEMWQIQSHLETCNEKVVDIDFIFLRLSELLSMPGDYWKRQPFHIKRRLQKFDFPEGVSFDGNNYRTRKVSSIFKLTSIISENISSNVRIMRPLIEQPNLANSPILPHSKLMSLLQEVQTDLKVYDEILKADSTEDPDFFSSTKKDDRVRHREICHNSKF
jgi:hypothetical protein